MLQAVPPLLCQRDHHRKQRIWKGSPILTLTRKLLLRIYGPQVEHLIDRKNELQILRRLARKKIGPRLLGTFINGRFEEFFHARTLTAPDLRVFETSKNIAKRMRELHDGIELLEEERTSGPFVWKNWDKWVTRCEEVIQLVDRRILSTDDTAKRPRSEVFKRRHLICGVEWSVFRNTVDRYRQWLNEQYGGIEGVKSQLVFSHNDVTTIPYHMFVTMLNGLDSIRQPSTT